MHPSYATSYCEPESPSTTGASTTLARPRILVLLATYNGAPWIREQLESILAQQAVDVRVAVRDDCSSDSTRLELARFAHHDKIRIAAVPDRGGLPARNFLSLICENPAGALDFVALSDQDDLWNEDKLERACRMLTASTAVGYSSATTAAWPDGRQHVTRLSGPPTAVDFLFEGAGQGCTFLLTREFYERVRTFLAGHRELTDEVHYHDWMIYALARSWNLRWCFDTRPSMRYRQHAGNHTGARGTVRGAIKRLGMIRQGWYRTQLRVIAGICRAAAPGNESVLGWHGELLAPQSWRRRLRVARFCLRGARRRRRDNLVAVLAALCGWI